MAARRGAGAGSGLAAAADSSQGRPPSGQLIRRARPAAHAYGRTGSAFHEFVTPHCRRFCYPVAFGGAINAEGGTSMRRVLLLVLALALAMPIAAWAQAKPDFSGTWT